MTATRQQKLMEGKQKNPALLITCTQFMTINKVISIVQDCAIFLVRKMAELHIDSHRSLMRVAG